MALASRTGCTAAAAAAAVAAAGSGSSTRLALCRSLSAAACASGAAGSATLRQLSTMTTPARGVRLMTAATVGRAGFATSTGNEFSSMMEAGGGVEPPNMSGLLGLNARARPRTVPAPPPTPLPAGTVIDVATLPAWLAGIQTTGQYHEVAAAVAKVVESLSGLQSTERRRLLVNSLIELSKLLSFVCYHGRFTDALNVSNVWLKLGAVAVSGWPANITLQERDTRASVDAFLELCAARGQWQAGANFVAALHGEDNSAAAFCLHALQFGGRAAGHSALQAIADTQVSFSFLMEIVKALIRRPEYKQFAKEAFELALPRASEEEAVRAFPYVITHLQNADEAMQLYQHAKALKIQACCRAALKEQLLIAMQLEPEAPTDATRSQLLKKIMLDSFDANELPPYDAHRFVSLLIARKDADAALHLFRHCSKRPFLTTDHHLNGMIHLFLELERVKDAEDVLAWMRFAKHSDRQPNTRTVNLFLDYAARHKNTSLVHLAIRTMKTANITPDAITSSIALKLSSVGMSDFVQSLDIIANTLQNVKAHRDIMADSVAFNSLLHHQLTHGNPAFGLTVLDTMKLYGQKPDHVTARTLLQYISAAYRDPRVVGRVFKQLRELSPELPYEEIAVDTLVWLLRNARRERALSFFGVCNEAGLLSAQWGVRDHAIKLVPSMYLVDVHKTRSEVAGVCTAWFLQDLISTQASGGKLPVGKRDLHLFTGRAFNKVTSAVTTVMQEWFQPPLAPSHTTFRTLVISNADLRKWLVTATLKPQSIDAPKDGAAETES